MSDVIAFGYGSSRAKMQLKRLNRHGIIAGATGTGKTVTLKVLAEQLSDAGIPVFLSDIKGDLNSLVAANTKEIDPSRLEKTHYLDYSPVGYPVELWDVLGENGTPIRMTISELGPVLLTRLLGLNDTQESILNIVFSVADERGLLLIDLMDLRAMLNFVAENAAELSQYYGNIPARSVGAILRSLVVLEQQGGKIFFGEPSLDIADLMRTAEDGRGVINVLQATQLFNQPTLYSTVLLSLLSELYEVLPEVGDLDKPKMVFFFDEAHVLFKDAPKVLLEKIELIVRLIRSKGVGVFFVTQNPTDIPDSVAAQLGNRIQHGLRAFTPKELKTVATVAETFRQEGDEDLAKVIQEL
ncbi:ATPase [Streptococcus suis]|nr:ATPase [Streptococcus suis]